MVRCEIKHFTSFSVLVSPADPSFNSPLERQALEVVTYIGCAISIGCLVLSIIAFIAFRFVEQTVKQVHALIVQNYNAGSF